MTFTYSLGFTSDMDRIRLRLGDTDSSAPQNQRLEDEEIAEFLLEYGSMTAALPPCAEALAAKFGRIAAEKRVGSLQLSYASGRYQTLMQLAETLRARAAASAKPYAGGISQSDKDSVEGDTDRAQPSFTRGMLDNREAGPQGPQKNPDSSVDGLPA